MKAASVSPRPTFWVPEQALDFPTMWDLIRQHRTPCGISNAFVAVLFFEESAFCNVIQNNGVGPAVGFGQMQIHDGDKVDFFRDVFKRDSRRRAATRDPLCPPIRFHHVVNSHDLSVKITWQYYQWLKQSKGKSTAGIMGAQAGGPNVHMIAPLKKGAQMLEKAITEKFTLESFVEALNYARRFKKPRSTAIPYRRYEDFWNFVIPEGYLKYGF